MLKQNPFPSEKKFLQLLKEEKNLVGFHDLHQIAHKYKLTPPKINSLLTKLNASRTHFSSTGIKTEKKISEIIKIIRRNLQKK